jgi:hypothetical protein
MSSMKKRGRKWGKSYLYVFFEYRRQSTEEADEEAEGRHVAGVEPSRGGKGNRLKKAR